MTASDEHLESQRLEVALMVAALPIVVLADSHHPAWLGECQYFNEQLRHLEIVYGEPDAVIRIEQAPDAPVYAFPPYDWPGWSADEEVEALLDGRLVKAVRRRSATSWKLRLLAPYDEDAAALVTLTGYGPLPESPELVTRADPLPLIRERNRRWAARWHEVQEQMQAELRKTTPYPAAYLMLADLAVRRARTAKEHVEHRIESRLRGRPPGPGWRNLWRLVRSTQAQLRGQSEDEASAAVRSLVQQARRLAEQAAWFDDERLAAAALRETVEWMAHRADVASRPAQEAWEAVHAHESAQPLLALTAPEGEWSAERGRLTRGWLRAWDAWAASHGVIT
ncbi:MAG: hypothetical protein HOV86_03780 [Thermoactinospora sp.]|nr:hypothetical protein [Thermoactinospora sp.]